MMEGSEEKSPSEPSFASSREPRGRGSVAIYSLRRAASTSALNLGMAGLVTHQLSLGSGTAC